MTAPSKLAVEIAEAIFTWTAETTPDSDEIAREEIATLIDAKIKPLVEDGARETERLDWILEHLYAAPILIGDYYLCPQVNGLGRGKTKRAAIDHARAQRPAQEGSDKP